jgi:arylsulfatase A-like enzyme
VSATRVSTIAGLALCVLACGGALEPTDTRPQRIVLIVMDATHAAHLSCYGGPDRLTPEIDRLARRGMRFERALSNTTWTLPSTTSLLTGQLQEQHGVVTNGHRVEDRHRLVSEAFRDAGWATASFTQNIYASAVHGLDRGFDDYTYYSMKAVEDGGPRPGQLIPQLISWLDAHDDENYFVYVHLRRPHSPYDPNPIIQARLAPDCPLRDGQRDDQLARADSQISERGSLLDAEAAAHVRHLYRANIANVDRAVGAIERRLHRDENALVVLTADHGEALGQHGFYGHGYHLFAESVDIPLIFAGPGIPPGTDSGLACTVDITPTLLDVAGLATATALETDGVSLLGRLHGEAAPPRAGVPLSGRYIEGKLPAHGVVDDQHKLVLDRSGQVHLFDRSNDPADRNNIAEQNPAVVARLLPIARQRREASRDLATTHTSDVEVNEGELKALGYLR